MSDPVPTKLCLSDEITSLPSSIPVLDILLFAGSPDEAAALVIRACESANSLGRTHRFPLRVSATGAHGLVHARSHSSFRSALHSCWINLPDGMPSVWLGRAKGARKMNRCYGPDFFALIMRRTANRSIRHFLCGGAEEVAESLKHACAEKFDNHRIAGTLTPLFLEVEAFDYAAIGAQIDQVDADIVWLGLGTPKQELFAENLSRHCNAKVIVTVGAAFDFHTGRLPRAPTWMQKSGLEWLFRLLSEPNRLWKRYAVIVPAFLWLATLDLVRWILSRPD